MSMTRRQVMKASIGSLGGVYLTSPLVRMAFAQTSSGDRFDTANGSVTVHPVSHASFVMETPGAVIYVDPVGGAEMYSGLPAADLILITHEHGDHLDVETLKALVGENTRLLTNPAVLGMLPDELKEQASAIANGESTEFNGIPIEAIPAYNITEERLQYHPEGRDNGYLLTVDGMRIYIAGDTEAVPEMRALTDIQLAFIPMNLPYTMGVEQAADGVAEFAPEVVYPYHYRGSDIDAFESLLRQANDSVKVMRGSWYS